MIIGIPREVKVQEHRVGMTPASAAEAVAHGHKVLLQSGAGDGIGCNDEQYRKAGAEVVQSAADVFARADMVVKVKEPLPQECAMLREGQILFTYLHLAPDPGLVRLLQQSGCTAIAYETVTDGAGGLPLLAPMSEVAGRMSIQVGAVSLQKTYGGRGVLLAGVPGVAPASVVILGGGVAGSNAARVAVGMGAAVTVLDKSLPKLRHLSDVIGPALRTIYATGHAIEDAVLEAALVIGAVLVAGAAAPKLVRRDHLAKMRAGAVLVDISIDQGGCFETSKATNHQDPTYEVDGIVHYCVANMPGAVPRTSTFALNNATLPYILALADRSWKRACLEDPHLRAGLNVHAGKVICEAVAAAQNITWQPALEALAA
jgi:alanine dehydrogenase